MIIMHRILLGSLAACFLLTSSCTDLEEEPYGQLAAGGFGQTESEFLAVVGAGYTQLYGLLGNHNSLWSLQEISSDEMVIPTRGADWVDGGQWVRIHQHQMRSSEESIVNAWNFLFGGVSTANRLIETLPRLNPDLAPQYIPELRALRALFYYYLMDTYGNVPIIASFSGGETNPTTSSRAEVYAFVVSELEGAIPELNEGKVYARFTRPAAQALLAKVYLNAEVYTGVENYEGALAQANEVINSGIYSLETDYFANFNATNDGSNENIFAIPYDEIFGTGFNLGQMTLHYSSQNTFASAEQPWNGYATLQDFYESYDSTDLRKGVPGDQSVPSNFLVGPQYDADGVTQVVDAAAEPSDPDGPGLVFLPEINEISPSALRESGARVSKFPFEIGFLQSLNNDFPILRYADILLVKAECQLRINGDNDQEALDLVNMVRSRSFSPEDTEEASLSSLNLDDLLAERGREMFAEMTRRQDLIRFGKFGDTWWEKPVSSVSKQIMPIPDAQLQANPNLVQNPGY